MALDFSSNRVVNKHLIPPAKAYTAGQVMAQDFKVAVDNTLAINELVGLAVIPPRHHVIWLDMYLDDIDSAATLVWSAGILNVAKTDLVSGSTFIAASTVGRSAGAQAVNDFNGIYERATWEAEATAPDVNEEKIVAMKVTTAATAVAGDIYGTVYYIADEDVF